MQSEKLSEWISLPLLKKLSCRNGNIAAGICFHLASGTLHGAAIDVGQCGPAQGVWR